MRVLIVIFLLLFLSGLAEMDAYNSCVLDNPEKAQSPERHGVVRENLSKQGWLAMCDDKDETKMSEDELLSCLSGPSETKLMERIMDIILHLGNVVDNPSSEEALESYLLDILKKYYAIARQERFWIEEVK